jgi:deoxyribodipyrimidine photolyase-related protein
MEERLQEYAERLGLPLYFRPSKSFLLHGDAVRSELAALHTPRLHDFYVKQRRKMNILMEGSNPVGGSWTFDKENRKPFPKSIQFLPLPKADWTAHTRELASLLIRLFPENPGDPSDFFLPTSRVQALKWLESFIQYRFAKFGPYEDAIHKSELLGFHSMLSPLLNTGLIFPGEVINAALECDVPLQSKEGFFRQIIGWREFVRGMYLTRGIGGNFFQHKRSLGQSWYEGTTGIPILDDSIKKVLRYGYVHHIERLMVIGNLMLLCEIHPDEVYRWFSELFVDAYDWVMVPNVYGMSQYADGGSFATKPYVASSRYLLKMSNYAKGPWCDTVDGLYWRFVKLHRQVFERNPRMKMMTAWLDKMTLERFSAIEAAAEKFIRRNTK